MSARPVHRRRRVMRLDDFVTRNGEQRLMTVADLVEVLKEQGAFDESWCLAHEASVIPNWHVMSCGADDSETCRTVSVLVFRLDDK